MPMHNDFADWYRAASVAPTSELLTKRWAAVEALVGALNYTNLQAILRMFSAPANREFVVPEFFDAAFRKADAAFPRKDHLNEVRALAGAILRQALEANSPFSVATALGMVCSTYGAELEAGERRDHLVAAERHLAQKAELARQVAFPPSYVSQTLPKAKLLEQLPADHFNPNNTPNLRDPLATVFVDQNTKTAAGINLVVASLYRVMQLQREELNLLWWLQNRFSRDLIKPFEEVALATRAAIFPMELADLTLIVPGPTAITGLLASALDVSKTSSTKVSIIDAVNSVPRKWREKRVTEDFAADIGDLCPVFLALAKSLETDGETDWVPVYRKVSGAQAEQPREAYDLALTLYRERMFLRSMLEIKK